MTAPGVSLSGGSIDSVYLNYGSTTVTGGSVNQRFQVSGFATAELFGARFPGVVIGYLGGRITVHGSNFAISGVPHAPGVVEADITSGNLTGLFPDGSPIDFTFARSGTALVLVPEPVTAVLVLVGLLALAARTRRTTCVLRKEIQHVAVIGVSDERLGEVPMAFVVCRPGAALGEKELIDWSRANMANYKVPRYVAFLPELPLTPSGKVQKFRLREIARELRPELFRTG